MMTSEKKIHPAIAIIILGVVVTLSLSGCSKKSSKTTTQTSAQNTASDSLFPEVDRSTLIAPSGYSGAGADSSGAAGSPGSGVVSTNLQIGSTTRVRAGRYNLEGIIRIKTVSSVSLESFVYDGTCKGFKLYLTRSNAETLKVVPFNMQNRVYNNETFIMSFPSGITINDIDAVAMTCSDKEEPIFVTQLE